jgi:ribosomal protein L7Ae-like RNA K-turn-binding protein
MDAALERRMLGLVGLGLRGQLVIVGVDRVRDAAHKGTLMLALVAPDAAKNSRDKVLPLLNAKKVQVIEGPGAVALGRAVGREQTAAVGIIDRQLAKGIRGLMNEGMAATAPAGTSPAR